MNQLSFLMKPASGFCNMRCKYCFYQDELAKRDRSGDCMMSEAVADMLIERCLAEIDQNGTISFAFQGGEPTLAGLDFFRHFVARCDTLNRKNVRVQYAIQTNGLLLTEEWAVFFHEHGFLVGISLDGEKSIHDELRPDGAGKGTWNRVEKAIRLLQKSGVETNLLCVVSRRCARSPGKVYRTLKKTGVNYLQFIPCLDPLDEERGSMPHSLLPEQYADFLCRLFDEWYRDWRAGDYTSVRLFDDYVHLMMGASAGTCSTCGNCGGYLVVEGNGSVYPCDFYCVDEWKLGSVCIQTLGELLSGETERAFLSRGNTLPSACTDCRWKALCSGGCKRDWLQTADGAQNYFCQAFRKFFAHSEARLAEIAKAEWMARKSLSSSSLSVKDAAPTGTK